MDKVQFISKLEETGFKRITENTFSKLDKVIVKLYSEENVKVVVEDKSKIFAFLDVYERVIDYVNSLELK